MQLLLWLALADVSLAHTIPPTIGVHGKLEGSLSWHDKNGENWVVYSTLRTTHKGPGVWGFFDDDPNFEVASLYMYLDHYVMENGKPRLLRSIRDQMENCDADLDDKFLPESFRVTDLDHDGYSEISFAYVHDRCVTDMGEFPVKLILLENGEKHIVRGISVMRSEDPSPENRKSVSRQIASWPAPFRDFARDAWARFSRY